MKNGHSEQFSKSTVINARLQNAIGLFSLVIALSLEEVGKKRKKLSLSLRKKAIFMVIELLRLKMMQAYPIIRCLVLHTTLQYIKIRTEKCREMTFLSSSADCTLSNEDDFIFNFLSS